MSYFYIEPEVAGTLGEKSVYDRRVHPPRVEKLDYEFDTWPEDGLIETFPCLISGVSAADALKSGRVTGI